MPFFNKLLRVKKRHQKSELGDEDGTMEEEEEGLLGGEQRESTPSPDHVGIGAAAGRAKGKKSGLLRSRTVQAVFAVIFFLAALVYLRTHGSPIAISGIISMKAPGCYNDYRGKPLLKIPIGGKFRDSLVQDQNYITAFPSGSYSSQVISTMHLLQAAQTSHRVAVLPPLQPTHNFSTLGFIPFSDIYDLPRLSKAINTPTLEWVDIKNTQHWNRWTGAGIASPLRYQDGYFGGKLEGLGCWSLSMTRNPNGFIPGDIQEGVLNTPKGLNLDISWTPIPFDHFIVEGNEKNVSKLVNGYFVNSLGYGYMSEHAYGKSKGEYLGRVEEVRKNLTETREVEVKEIPTPSRISRNRLEPDKQMLCFDSLEETASYSVDEGVSEYSPVWNQVGRQLHFNPRLKGIAASILNNIIFPSSTNPNSAPNTNSTGNTTMPTYIAVDIRRHEFQQGCFYQGLSPEKCHTPLSEYSKKAGEIQKELSTLQPSSPFPIIVISDEPYTTPQYYVDNYHLANDTSETFWEGVKVLGTGWKIINHSELDTGKKFGVWYPKLVDDVIVAYAGGLVGTKNSANSVIGRSRVVSWSKGPVKMI